MRILWLLASLLIICAATFPFHFTTDRDILAVHLAHISPNPLLSPDKDGRLSIADVVDNILFFLPFGALGALSVRSGRSTLRQIALITATAAALSLSVETLQLFTRDRITSTADVAANTLGGLLGAIAASRVGRG
jgi:glycopeptide antibiotics resistance protein